MVACSPASRSLLLRLLGLASAATLAIACGSEDGEGEGNGSDAPPAISDPGNQPPTSDDPTIKEKLAEKPWEVISNKGETYLPNVFYADASQNEQIMPWAFEGHVMIDRLVYPTLGNPNLYTKSDATDQLVSVLRIEDDAYAHLGVSPEALAGSSLSKLPITNDPATGFAFFLVPRDAREHNTEATQPISSGNGTGVFRVYPNEVLVNPIPADMPASLKARKTLRFVFKQGAMSRVPAGLYDLRMEVRKNNEPGDANVREAAFITFNGDLHNGGSPASLRQRTVAWTYNNEAKAIVDALNYLPVPIFLTAGNHDGYVSTGHVPGAVKTVDSGLLDNLDAVINEATPKAWPDFGITKFHSYITKTEAAGRSQDVRHPRGAEPGARLFVPPGREG